MAGVMAEIVRRKNRTHLKHATSITIALDETKTRKVLLLRHAQTPVYCPRVWVSKNKWKRTTLYTRCGL